MGCGIIRISEQRRLALREFMELVSHESDIEFGRKMYLASCLVKKVFASY